MEDLHKGITPECHSHLIQKSKISLFWLSEWNGWPFFALMRAMIASHGHFLAHVSRIQELTFYSKCVQLPHDVT